MGRSGDCEGSHLVRSLTPRAAGPMLANARTSPKIPIRATVRWLASFDTYAAHSGEHDDRVLAVALAVWFGNLAHKGGRGPDLG